MMQVQGSNMMEMGGNPAAAFWGARHASWAGHSHANPVATSAASHSDPKMAEKLMSELQVSLGSVTGYLTHLGLAILMLVHALCILYYNNTR